jgi:hypothetical protein
MSYRINRSDGELILDLTDGTIDTTATDITLIGRNYKGFGEWINENFVKVLENFASTQQPVNPLTGQLWYDKQDQRLKVFNGTFFRPASGTVVNSDQPANLVAGDIWIDNENNRLYIFDGTDLTLVGPTYDAGQGRTGLESDSQIDTNNITHTIMKMYIGGVLIGIFATEDFIIPYDYIIPGLDGDPEDTFNPPRQILRRGFNIASKSDETGLTGFWWRGTASSAKALIDDNGNVRTTANFLPTDGDGVTTGSLTVKNSKGVTIGIGDRPYQMNHIFGNTVYVDNLELDTKYEIRVKNSTFQNSFIPGLSIDAETFTNKMFPMTNVIIDPITGLYDFSLLPHRPRLEVWGDGFYAGDVEFAGSISVKGDLNVAGETVYMNTENLYIQDKNIELAIGTDEIPVPDADIDDGGIILRSADGDKIFQWYVADRAWHINQHLNIKDGPSITNPALRINGVDILDATTLHSSVTTAAGLTQVGVLSSLTVDDVTVDGNTLTVVNGAVGLTIAPNGPVSMSSNRITDVEDPIDDNDVVNKKFIEEAISGAGVVLSFDINGLLVGSDPVTQPYNAGTIENVRLVANQMRNANTTLPGTELRVLATRIAEMNATVPITVASDNSATLQVSKVTVRNVDNSGTVAVVQDIAANPAGQGETAEVTMTVERYKYTFTSDGNNWLNPVVEQIVI